MIEIGPAACASRCSHAGRRVVRAAAARRLRAGLLLARELRPLGLPRPLGRVAVEQRIAEADHGLRRGAGLCDARRAFSDDTAGSTVMACLRASHAATVVALGLARCHQHLERQLRQRAGRHDQQMLARAGEPLADVGVAMPRATLDDLRDLLPVFV